MIFNTFDPNQDVVAGRTTRIASGFWSDGVTEFLQSDFIDDFWSLTGSSGGYPSFGTSVYDVHRTMYYLNMYPGADARIRNDPYFSIAYGSIAGDIGSGSFNVETGSIKVSPAKAIYTQYKNILLGSFDLDGMFTLQSGSTTVTATDIWVLNFSAYKMKDKIDEGLFEFSLSGALGTISFIDNSPFTTQTQAVYQLIAGTLASPPATPTYEGLGLLYPADGIVILNAALVAQKVGIPIAGNGLGSGEGGPGGTGGWLYTVGTSGGYFTYNHKTLAKSIQLSSNTMKVRKSEYIPSRHYFIRVKNREFNYSNNPTYVYDGTDGIAGHAKGTIRNIDFVNDPKTYITTIGLYNDSNELVAVGKLSRPAVKSFDSELLIKVRLDF